MDFYVMDLMRIVSDIVESTRGKAPNWGRLELKGQDLAVLGQPRMAAIPPLSISRISGVKFWRGYVANSLVSMLEV